MLVFGRFDRHRQGSYSIVVVIASLALRSWWSCFVVFIIS
jgi:hypothetical protein